MFLPSRRGKGLVDVRGELGEKQLDFLIAHRRKTGQFEPSRTGRPWPICSPSRAAA